MQLAERPKEAPARYYKKDLKTNVLLRMTGIAPDHSNDIIRLC